MTQNHKQEPPHQRQMLVQIRSSHIIQVQIEIPYEIVGQSFSLLIRPDAAVRKRDAEPLVRDPVPEPEFLQMSQQPLPDIGIGVADPILGTDSSVAEPI